MSFFYIFYKTLIGISYKIIYKIKKYMYKIYKLVYEGEVIYVGITKLKYLNSRKSTGYSKIPIDIVEKSNMEVIEETDDRTRERFWILYYKNTGCKLYNIENGYGFNREEYEKERWKRPERKKLKKIWAEKNKELINKRHRESYEINKEKVNERRRELYILKKERQ